MTKIKNCDCHHKFQDKRYGKARRVHNEMKTQNEGDTPRYRCTVCGQERY